jgi:hypothetical protein
MTTKNSRPDPTDPLTWETTPSELVGIFRESILALLPTMDRARIPWRDETSYDDWDAIATTLYEQIVVRSIRYSLPEGKLLEMAPYDIARTDYSAVSFVRVLTDDETILAFCGFRTRTKPFDTVACKTLDDLGRVTSETFVEAESAIFSVYFRGVSGRRELQTLAVFL